MTYGILFEQGDIVVVPFPFSDLSGFKQRPVLILSNDVYNSQSDDLVTCGITTHIKNVDYSIVLENSDLKEGYIPVTSRIRIDKLFTLEKGIVRKKIAKVNKNVLEEVKKEFFKLV